MSLKRISYSTAGKIIDIYSGLLISEKKTIYQKFGYSELKGYDIIDVDNALKLQLAYKIFNTYTIDDKAVSEFERYVHVNNNCIWQFFYHFVPDEIVPDLDALEPGDDGSMLKSINIEPDYRDSEHYKKFQNQETQESFLQFCLSVGPGDIDYWNKVYARLNLVWDERDTRDRISICIKEKELFHRSYLERQDAVKKSIETDQVGQDTDKPTKKETFVQTHRTKFYYTAWFMLLVLGIYITTFQKIAIFIVAGLVLLNILLMRDTFKSKWELPYNCLILLSSVAGLISSSVGTYVIVLILFSEIIKTILLTRKKQSVL